MGSSVRFGFRRPCFSPVPLCRRHRVAIFPLFRSAAPSVGTGGDGPAATSRGAARLPASATFPALTILLRTARFPRNGPPALPQRGRPWSSAIKRKTRLPIFRIEERLLFAPQLPVCGNGSGAAGPRPFSNAPAAASTDACGFVAPFRSRDPAAKRLFRLPSFLLRTAGGSSFPKTPAFRRYRSDSADTARSFRRPLH